MKKFAAFLITFSILINSASAWNNVLAKDSTSSSVSTIALEQTLPENLELEQALSHGHIQRLKDSEKDLNSATFANVDGSKTVYLFTENIKYIDNAGKTLDKSNKLIRKSSGYTNPNNDVTVFYPDKIDTGVSVSHSNRTITIIPELSESAKADSASLLNNRESRTTPDKIRYNNVFGDGTILEYTQTFSGLKETIILNKNIGRSSFTFTLNTDGLILSENNGELLLLNPLNNEAIATIGAIQIWDSDDNYYSGEYLIRTVKSGQTYKISIVCSDLLSQKTISYPLYIDPSITINEVGTGLNIQDATLFQGNAEVYSNQFNLFVGDHTAMIPFTQKGVARTFVKLTNLFESDTMRDILAQYHQISFKYNFASLICNTPTIINAHVQQQDWNVNSSYSEAIWNAKGPFTGTTTVTSGSAGSSNAFPRNEIDITYAVQQWQKGAQNYGIMLKLNDESQTAISLASNRSGEVNGSAVNKPYVVVNYTTDFNNTVFRFKNSANGKYLNVANGYDSNNINVFLYSDDNSKLAQEFRFIYDATEQAYRIHALCSMNGRYRVLDVYKSANGAAGLTSGCNVQIYKPTDTIANTFLIEQTNDGYYKLVMKYNTNIALTGNTSGNGTNSGTSSTSVGNVYMATYTGASNQKWILERTETSDIERYYGAMNLAYPFRGSSVPLHITSSFGYRVNPITGGSGSSHSGIDIAASAGTPLYSIFDGTVKVIDEQNDPDWGRGEYIIVEANNDYHCVYGSTTRLRFMYMHMIESATVTNPAVVVGATVTTETLIGKVGSTGASTGPHLHLGFIKNGSTSAQIKDAISPQMFYPNLAFC